MEIDSEASATAVTPQVRAGSQRARVHLIVGPVGAGKSTLGLRLARERSAVRLTLDEWMALLFRPDRPEANVMQWYVERAARCIEQICRLTHSILDAGSDVILEIGLLQRREREAFYRRIADDGSAAGSALVVYVLDAPRDLRRARVQERNTAQGPTFSVLVPLAIFELASDLWQPLEADECEGRDVRLIDGSGMQAG